MRQFWKDVQQILYFLYKHWLTVLVVIVIILSIGISIFHFKHHSYHYIPNVSDNIYNFLNEWASAVAPALTFIGIATALYMSYRSLRKTQEIKEKERKERLLNEIIDWAKDIFQCWYEKALFLEHDENLQQKMDSLISCLMSKQVESRYISVIVSLTEFSSHHELSKSVENLKNSVEEHRSLVHKWRNILRDGTDPTDEYEKRAADHILIFRENIFSVIEEATKLKIKDIQKSMSP